MHDPRLKSRTDPRAWSFAETTLTPGTPTSTWSPCLIGMLWMRAPVGSRQENARAFRAVMRLSMEPSGKLPIFVVHEAPMTLGMGAEIAARAR